MALLRTLPPMTAETAVPDPIPEAETVVGAFAIGTTTYTLTAWRRDGRDLFLLTGPRGAQYGLMPHFTQRYEDVTTLALVNVGRGRGFTTPRWANGLLWVHAPGRFGYVR